MFQRIRDEKPEVLKKVTAFQGDVTFDGKFLFKYVVNAREIINPFLPIKEYEDFRE